MEAGTGTAIPQKKWHSVVSPIFIQAFTLTFLAEWGDRSQLTTIILAAREVGSGSFSWTLFAQSSRVNSYQECQKLSIGSDLECIWKDPTINPWTNNKFDTFLTPFADEKHSTSLCGTMRNLCVFKEISKQKALFGLEHNRKQCQEALNPEM